MSEYIYASNGEPLVNECGVVFTAAEGIVRCRDCAKYVTTWPGRNPDWCVEFKRRTKQHEYCAWGERKEGCDD